MSKVTIDYDLCQDCQTCVSVCPMGVYELQSEKVIVANEDECIACRACEASCPTGAITIEE